MRRILTLLATPLLLVQGVWVVARAQRLPEAEGERIGIAGGGSPLRLLILGDSSAAGVGVLHQRDALAGRLAAHLSHDRAVSWTLVAKSGATTATALAMLADLPEDRFDMAVVALGVNDTKNGVSEHVWCKNYAAILNTLETRFGIMRICVSGLPPMGHFPLLPRPLRTVLGRRADRFDRRLRELADAWGNVTHVPLDFPMDVSMMASDGFHPGPQVYDAWAARLAAALTR